jgi:hypothetical protein
VFIVIWWVFDLFLMEVLLDSAGLATLFWIGIIMGVVSLAFRRS